MAGNNDQRRAAECRVERGTVMIADGVTGEGKWLAGEISVAWCLYAKINGMLPYPVSASKISKRTDLAPNKGGPFAAALRTLAKNAGPDIKDGECRLTPKHNTRPGHER
ncbi:hypothetical protein KGM_201121 [Danaus plexippus plexippus]|uniref:Uncharacterized protein n=1 Tax=Danaus plexippus plexippus TaxID=278856 RepID=A0A212F4W6_DANPL|nr:hypothetical protein KGM_201121 [Danaus plexippus plexippus]